jgi:membrane protease YdiL (CAAX protease family)
MTERDSFPGLAGAAVLVVAMWLCQVLVGLTGHVLLPPDAGPQALLAAAVLSTGAVAAAHILRRKLQWRGVVHPSPSSLGAMAALVVPPVLLLAPAVFVLACFADDLTRFLDPISDSQRSMLEQLLDTRWWNVLAVVVAGPVFEELLFRAIILRGLLARMAPGKAIVASALVFGIAHIEIHQAQTAALVGLPLGWLYVRFRSAVPGMALHATVNALAVFTAAATRPDLPATELPTWFLLVSLAALVAGARMLLALQRLRQSQA